MVIMYHCHPCVSAAGHEASEGDGAAREKPERTVGETGEVQWAGTALKRKEIWTLQQEYSLLISCLEEMTKENCVPSNSTSADCCSLYQVQKYPTTTFITQTSCIKQKHFSVYVPLCSASFLSVNETQSWRLEQFSGWFVPQITAAVCIICAVNCN